MPAPSPKSARLDVNGASIHCETSGTGEPIVLVHSGITDSRMWDPQGDALSKWYRVVRYDLRGFGRSALPAEPYAHHEDLFALFKGLDLGPAVLIAARDDNRSLTLTTRPKTSTRIR